MFGKKMKDNNIKKTALPQLEKIEQQIHEIMQMIQDERYCIDVINRITAAEQDLDGVTKVVMKQHFESCVSNAILQGTGQNKIDELITAVFKHSKR